MDSMPGPILENLRRIEGKLDGLHSAKICQIEEVLLKLGSAISSQNAILQEVQTQLRMQGNRAQEAQVTSACSVNTGCSSVTPPPVSRPAPILKKKKTQEFKTEEVELIPLPEDPQLTLAVVPGEVEPRPQRNSIRNSIVRGPQEPGPRLSLSSQEVKRSNVQIDFIEASSVDELSLKTTRKLLRGFSACSATFSLDERLQKSPMAERSASKHSLHKDAVLERTQNISLDELHKNHNAVVSFWSMRRSKSLDTKGAMPLTAEFLLATSGILEACSLTLWRLWVLCMLAAWQGNGSGFCSSRWVFARCFFRCLAIPIAMWSSGANVRTFGPTKVLALQTLERWNLGILQIHETMKPWNTRLSEPALNSGT